MEFFTSRSRDHIHSNLFCWYSVITSRSISPHPPPTFSRMLRTALVTTAVRSRAIFSSSSQFSGSLQDNGSVFFFTSALYFTRSWHCRTVASELHRGRAFSLPPPVSSPLSQTCNESHPSLLSSSAGVIDPRHLLQCHGALHSKATSGGHNFKLSQLYGSPLVRGEASF
jgi:hypothetical protein